ncbi:PIN domain-containing protein [Streptomyces tricolor]|nr:PIN domain-containing protein [Streptomyces tricolor]
MVLDRPMLLPVLDTNVVLVEACALAKKGDGQDKITALAGTGRATPYIAAHVPAEVDEHLTKMAAHFKVPERQARRVLQEQILPALRVVDLEIRDHLSPKPGTYRRVDPRSAATAYRGDLDDAPTMALAEFLAPCVIVTQDTVFSRFGLALIDWIPVVQGLLRLAGLEATAANALLFSDLACQLLGAGAHRLFALAARNPLPTTAALGGLLWCSYRRGYLDRDTWRRHLPRE